MAGSAKMRNSQITLGFNKPSVWSISYLHASGRMCLCVCCLFCAHVYYTFSSHTFICTAWHGEKRDHCLLFAVPFCHRRRHRAMARGMNIKRAENWHKNGYVCICAAGLSTNPCPSLHPVCTHTNTKGELSRCLA